MRRFFVIVIGGLSAAYIPSLGGNSSDAATEKTPPASSYADATCRAIDATGVTSAPCEVSVWRHTVTATIDMTPSEARKACHQMANLVASAGGKFDAGWQLVIKSPYSDENSIAFCALHE